MFVLLHGAAGGWDELAIAVAAFAVLWVAVKLAGRKTASDDDDGPESGVTESAPEDEGLEDPTHSTSHRG